MVADIRWKKEMMSFNKLEEFGRIKLSKNFLMREFLYSEISQIYGVPNIPSDPELAIEAGKNLCEKVLEPIQEELGRISIRSGYRSCDVNETGNKNNHKCAENEKNYAGHIWDQRHKDGYIGATACIVVTSFLPYYEKTGDWTALAWWIHDHISDYASMEFFPKLAAFNITWNDAPNYKKWISSHFVNPHTGKKGYLTKDGMDNFSGSHEEFYRLYLKELSLQ